MDYFMKESDVLSTIHKNEFEGEDENGRLIGKFRSSGIRPNFSHQASY